MNEELTQLNLDYDEISPITGEKCVLVEPDEQTGEESRLCMQSGYTTKESWKTDSEAVEAYESHITTLMYNLRYIDTGRGVNWYPATMTMPMAILYPAGDSADNWRWQVSKIVDIIGEERTKYPVPGRENEYFTQRIDVENAINFESTDFISALDYFYGLMVTTIQEA
jgi:hypothetical protein